MKPLPHTVEDLIEELEEIYPPRCIQVGERPEDAHRYAGQVDLVQGLRARLEAMRKRDNAIAKELIKDVRPQDQGSGSGR